MYVLYVFGGELALSFPIFWGAPHLEKVRHRNFSGMSFKMRVVRSLPEFRDFELFGTTIVVANNTFGLFGAHPLGR